MTLRVVRLAALIQNKESPMTLRTLMQAGPNKALELFTRLSETSDGALKTREKLFAELKAELELHASLEEEHLFPLLRKNAETRDLVVDGLKDNKELRAHLAALETLPKNDETFLQRLSDLQKLFRQHARDDKKELLPAVQRALSTEQVQEVAGRIEASQADAEQARQDEAEERRAKARQEREQAQLEAEAAEREQADRKAAEDRARETAQRSAELLMKPVEITVEATRQVARLVPPSQKPAGAVERSAAASPQPAPQPAPLTAMFLWPWLGALATQPRVPAATDVTRAPRSAEEVIPLGEEVLEVGKRTVNRGTARIRRFVVETPVEQQVTLLSERVVVERRRPVTDKVTGEVLTEVTVEVTETEEMPVVEKRVRLREEIVVRTERSRRVKTVRETVRRDEVEIRQPRRQHLTVTETTE